MRPNPQVTGGDSDSSCSFEYSNGATTFDYVRATSAVWEYDAARPGEAPDWRRYPARTAIGGEIISTPPCLFLYGEALMKYTRAHENDVTTDG